MTKSKPYIRQKYDKQNIITPEGVSFSMHLAGSFSRFLAWIIDFIFYLLILNLIILIYRVFVTIMSSFIEFFTVLSFSWGIIMILAFIVDIGYNIFFEYYKNGQTPGKMFLKIRVVDELGLQLKFSQVLMRNLLRPIDILPFAYLLGSVITLLTKKNQRLGDLAASTIVVKINPPVSKELINELVTDKFNSFMEKPHLAARLKKNIEPAEAKLILNALMRRDTIKPEHRPKLFKEFADYLRSVQSFPEEACLGLSDEQYVRNVIDIIFHDSYEMNKKKTSKK